MKVRSLAVIIGVIFLNTYLAWLNNRPTSPGESRYPVMGLSYNHFQRDQSPFDGQLPDQAMIEKDLELVASKTRSIRIYTSRGMQFIPSLAEKHNLSVIASAFLNANNPNNEAEVEAGIKLAGYNRNVTRLILGNETQLTHTLPRDELVDYLVKARKRLRTPVSTAEPWDFWVDNPEFVSQVDFIAIHVLPYWAGTPINQGVDYVFDKYYKVKQLYPYRMVVIAETGWPSDGPQRGAAEATEANQAHFIREFVRRAEREKVNYNIIEAFDQPWKSKLEGRAGEHWGIMNAARQEKFPITGPVLEEPDWIYWTISSNIVGFLVMFLFFRRRPKLSMRGRIFSACTLQAAATAITYLAHDAAGQYMSPGDIVFWTAIFSVQALLAIIFLTDAAEITDVIGHRPLKRRFSPATPTPTTEAPLVSVHLACCKEPPEMVIATLDSLAAMDYPNFEVIVVDNNTFDPALWQPIQEHCTKLGGRFRFFTLGKWPGFKAGALNYALKVTNPEATVVGVVDADYLVSPNWLSITVPYFNQPDVAVVQAPQEHRAWGNSLFQTMENDEYSGFFRIGMVQRNEENAIIQHGTMTLICRRSLDQLNGWAEWCIGEDAELGLRLLCQGKKTVYINQPLGHGLVPDSYEAYSKQRFRWAYGGMRIARRYWRELFGLKPGLNRSQRYHFIKGWLPWVGDGLHLLFTLTALVWSVCLLVDPLQTEFPEPIFIYPALALVALRPVGTASTYATRVKIGRDRTLLAMIAGGSLTHTIAKGVVQGLLIPGKPFYRTPKMDKAPPLLRSILIAREEILLAFLLLLCGGLIIQEFGTINDDAVLWVVALVIQALPYFASIIAAVISSLGSALKRKISLTIVSRHSKY